MLVVSVLCFACNCNKSVDELPTIDIGSNAFNFEKIYLSDYATEIKYIPMEVDLNFLLGMNVEFLADFSDDYILETDGLKCLLYGRDGKFIRTIGQQGRGPGEYIGISAIFLRGENIYIYDYYTDDLIEYKTDGSFVKRHNSGFTVDEKFLVKDAYIINDSMIIGDYENRTGKEEYKAFLFDKDGTITESYRNYELFNLDPGVKQANSGGHAIYFRFEDKVFFKEYLNDTLFVLSSDNRLEPYYVFDFGKYKLPLSNRGKGLAQMDMKSYISIYHLQQTEKFIFIVCRYGKYFPAYRLTVESVNLPGGDIFNRTQNSESVLGIYSKESGDLVFSEPTDTDNHLYTTGFYNDIDAGPRFMPRKMVNDSTIAMKIPFYRLMMHV